LLLQHEILPAFDFVWVNSAFGTCFKQSTNFTPIVATDLESILIATNTKSYFFSIPTFDASPIGRTFSAIVISHISAHRVRSHCQCRCCDSKRPPGNILPGAVVWQQL